jgi:hypothetical protein
MRWIILAFVLFFASGCDGDEDGGSPIGGTPTSEWTIGPVIKGKNYSVGFPLHPPACEGVVCVDFPGGPQAHAHYITKPSGSLLGKTQIYMRYRVEIAPNDRFAPRTDPLGPSLLTLYFQRKGDDWSGNGKYEAYRWYASFAVVMPIEAGEHEVVAPFSSLWTAVRTSDNVSAARAWREALAEAGTVGFVLGGGDGLGHGVYSTGPARIVVTKFEVQ